MKKLALGIVGLTALVAAPAMAADMSYKAAPPPVSVFSWTGCYIGVHGGGGWQTSSYTTDGGRVLASGVGWLGGGQIGCNVQYRWFVFGVEGEFWGSTLSDRSAFQDADFVSDSLSRNRWDGAVSVRSGVTFDRAFVYGKLGVVWGKFDYTTDSSSTGVFGGTFTERGDAIFTGVLIGVGFEYALTDNWTTKFEYNYIDYGNKLVDFTDVDCSNFTGTCTTSTNSRTIKEVKQIAKIGLNYKFGYDGAVVAKY
jgi:outer membrane immunogenic protein